MLGNTLCLWGQRELATTLAQPGSLLARLKSIPRLFGVTVRFPHRLATFLCQQNIDDIEAVQLSCIGNFFVRDGWVRWAVHCTAYARPKHGC